MSIEQRSYCCSVSRCPGLRVDFLPGEVDAATRELANNWIMKIVSIRGIMKDETTKNGTLLFIKWYIPYCI